jgi:hypothetical protein
MAKRGNAVELAFKVVKADPASNEALRDPAAQETEQMWVIEAANYPSVETTMAGLPDMDIAAALTKSEDAADRDAAKRAAADLNQSEPAWFGGDLVLRLNDAESYGFHPGQWLNVTIELADEPAWFGPHEQLRRVAVARRRLQQELAGLNSMGVVPAREG